MLQNLSDKELVHHVDNKPSATELERELANRLDAKLMLMTVLRTEAARLKERVYARTEDDML